MSSRLEWCVNLNPYRLSPTLDPEEMDRRLPVALGHLLDLGVTQVRTDLLMAWLLPAEGQENPAAIAWYHRFFDALERAGIGVYAILYNPPAWACARAEADPRSFLGPWRAFCRLVAREFPQLRNFQVWNEPNNYFSHWKGDFNFFRRRRFGLGKRGFTVPVGVDWPTLAGLFRIAREELPDGSLLIYNVLATCSSYVPVSLPTWTEWDHFTDRLLEEAGSDVDAIALDHYPETWEPGSGPDWTPLRTLLERVNDPRSSWYRKTALIGEVGYSSCDNFDLLDHRLRLKFFARSHTQATMAAWFSEALTHLADQLRPERLPHNRLHLINVYELYDAAVSFEGEPAKSTDLIGIEHHFGLVDAHLRPKQAYHLFKEIVRGGYRHLTGPLPNPAHPVGLLFKGSKVTKAVSRALHPPLGRAVNAMRPVVRKRDLGFIGAGALFVLYQLWKSSSSAGPSE